MNRCPATGKQCNKCKGYNHFSTVCKNKLLDQVKVEVSSDDDDYYCTSICSSINSSREEWYQELKIVGIAVNFKIDSGSDINIISIVEYKQIQKVNNEELKFKRSNCKLKAYGDNKIQVAGEMNLV